MAFLSSIVRRIFILPVRIYQRLISPILPSACIYYPTCSHYAADSILRFGVSKGIFLGTLRILRCNQLFVGGVDEVPERFSFRGAFQKYGEHRRGGKKGDLSDRDPLEK